MNKVMKVSYHIYHNWRAKDDNGTLHKSNCGDCNYGNGKKSNKIPGRNGVWLGPFDRRVDAVDYLNRFNSSTLCTRCNP